MSALRPGPRARAAAVVTAATAIALAGHTAAHADASGTPAPGTPVKYFVVPPDQNGPDETLYEIAKDTLGDGDRYREIFKLNQGKVMPEGDRLTDPTSIEPGLVLVLPADASGPGVRFGPLPTQVPASDVTPTPSPTPRPTAPPATPAPTTHAPAAHPPSAHHAPTTAPAAQPETGSGHRPALIAGGSGALVLLAGGTTLLVRRRRRHAGEAAEAGDAPVTAWSLSPWPDSAFDATEPMAAVTPPEHRSGTWESGY